jgi:mannose-6-phosphate isomerase-like protein (cupin superfamily)
MAGNGPQPPPVGRRNDSPDTTAPDGSDIRLLVDGRQQATQASLVEVSLPAGSVSRPVWHRTVEEIWYVLEGEGQVWRCPPDAQPESIVAVPVGPGDAVVIPTGWRFQFSAGSALRFLCYTCPPWPGDDEAVPADRGGLGDATV